MSVRKNERDKKERSSDVTAAGTIQKAVNYENEKFDISLQIQGSLIAPRS